MSRKRDGGGSGGRGYFLEIWQRGDGSGAEEHRSTQRERGGGEKNENQCAGLEGWETPGWVPWSPSNLGYRLFAIAVRDTSGAMGPPGPSRCRRDVRRSRGPGDTLRIVLCLCFKRILL